MNSNNSKTQIHEPHQHDELKGEYDGLTEEERLEIIQTSKIIYPDLSMRLQNP